MFSLFCLASCFLLPWCLSYNIDTKTNNSFVMKGLEDGSYFGYSLAFHGTQSANFIPKVIVGAPLGKDEVSVAETKGVAYSCDPSKSSDHCELIKIDKKVTNLLEKKDKQWLGATVYSSGVNKPIAICAPRYSEINQNRAGTKLEYYTVGRCFVTVDQVNVDILTPYTINGRYGDDATKVGLCNAGISVSLRSGNGSAVIGAVGKKYQSRYLGDVAMQNEDNKEKFTSFRKIIPVNNQSGFSYLGYSLAIGNFSARSSDDEEIAAGDPRGGISGQVIVFRAKAKKYKVLSPPQVVNKQYMYFGASVCAVDVNDDGYSDLLVGAPFYSEKGKRDVGRVYVYLSVEISGNRELKLSFDEKDRSDPGLKGSKTPAARFGWAIARAGDLNDDGYQDVVISAPQDQPDIDGDGIGNGAIYIYHGSQNGLTTDYQQKITAQDMKDYYGGLNQFGFAVTGNMDTDNNGYPDLAVGAWQSDRVMVLRTRPVLRLQVELRLSMKDISIYNFTANCKDGSVSTLCLRGDACFRYTGKGLPAAQVVDYVFELDNRKRFKRVYFRDDKGEKEYRRVGSVSLTKEKEKCVPFENIFVEDIKKLEKTLSNDNDVTFKINNTLKLASECEKTKLCPVLDRDLQTVVEKQVMLILNCTGNTCDYDLDLGLSVEQRKVVIDKTETLTSLVTLKNKGESAYYPSVRVTHDPTLQYETFASVEKKTRINMISEESVNGSVSELFKLQGILEQGEKVTFKIQYSARNVQGRKKTLLIHAVAIASTGQDTNELDNTASDTIRVEREVILSILGTSKPTAIIYPTAMDAIGTPNGDRINFTNVNASLVGPPLQVNFVVMNTGKSSLQSIKLNIQYPFREKGEDKDQEYIVYPVGVRMFGNGRCNRGFINPEKIQNTDNKDLIVRQKRSTELNAENKETGGLECEIEELKSNERFTVQVLVRLWVQTLLKYDSDEHLLRIDAHATYKDSLNGKRLTFQGKLEVKVSRERSSLSSKKTPIWIIIVSVLAGILLLIIAVLVLYKFGFFKRSRPPTYNPTQQSESGQGSQEIAS